MGPAPQTAKSPPTPIRPFSLLLDADDEVCSPADPTQSLAFVLVRAPRSLICCALRSALISLHPTAPRSMSFACLRGVMPCFPTTRGRFSPKPGPVRSPRAPMAIGWFQRTLACRVSPVSSNLSHLCAARVTVGRLVHPGRSRMETACGRLPKCGRVRVLRVGGSPLSRTPFSRGWTRVDLVACGAVCV